MRVCFRKVGVGPFSALPTYVIKTWVPREQGCALEHSISFPGLFAGQRREADIMDAPELPSLHDFALGTSMGEKRGQEDSG